jgi:hypothetical protein
MATHLIQFPGREEYKKAVTALSDVPSTRVGLPDYKMMVTEAHLDALDHSGIPYTDLTKDAKNGSATPLQS